MKPRLLPRLALAVGIAFSAGCSPHLPEADAGAQALHSAPPPTPSRSQPAAPEITGQSTRAPVTLLGRVQSDAQATLSTRMPARIVTVLIREGEAVQRGQLLVQLDESEARAQLVTAQAGVEAARAQAAKAREAEKAQRLKADTDLQMALAGLKQAQTKRQQAALSRDALRADSEAEKRAAQEGIIKAELALERAKETLQSLEELATVGGVSRSDLDGARAQLKIAQSDVETAKTQAERLENGPKEGLSYRLALAQQDMEAAETGVQQAQASVEAAKKAREQTIALARQDIEAAQAALTQAEAGVEAARAALSSLRLLSPLDGVAVSVSARVGEIAQPGAPLVSLASLTGLRIEALVPARQLPQLRVGQAAQAAVDTRPEQTFPLVVQEIARVAEPDGRSFRVLFRFARPVALRPGQTARILIPPDARRAMP